jgi:hypothetical protein
MEGKIIFDGIGFQDLIDEIRSIVRQELATKQVFQSEPEIDPTQYRMKRKEILEFLRITANQFNYLVKREILLLDQDRSITKAELLRVIDSDIRVHKSKSGRTRIEKRQKAIL